MELTVEGIPDELVRFVNGMEAATKNDRIRVENNGSGVSVVMTHPTEHDRMLSRDWCDFLEATPDQWRAIVDQMILDVPTIEPMMGALPYSRSWDD